MRARERIDIAIIAGGFAGHELSFPSPASMIGVQPSFAFSR